MREVIEEKTKNIPDDKLSETTFYSTNNAWVNNGLITLTYKMRLTFEDDIKIKFNEDGISLSSVNHNIFDCIAKSLHDLAARGTYNFSTAFKILNLPPPKGAGANYMPPKEYPMKKGERNETRVILDEERKILKENKITNTNKKQQIWKQRMNYMGNEDNYLKIGLNFNTNDVFKKLKKTKNGVKICAICGQPTNIEVEVKSFFNPFSGEHHNNVEDGYSTDIRKKIRACPKCITSSYFSLFNSYIPFYYIPQRETYLAIPNSVNLEILRKINNNLSCKGQYIDFHDESCTRYSTNIRSLPAMSKSAAMLALLHNIKNRYSREEPEELIGPSFEEVSKDEFIELTEWWFISTSYNIIHIKANEKIYDLLRSQPDPDTNEEVYLIPDVLSNIRLRNFDENDVEKFYNGILLLDSRKISEALFRLAKESISTADRIYISYIPQGSSPLILFRDIFLDKILEVSDMLEEEIRNACRNIANSIGKGFSEDVGMMTKFAYSTGPEEFRDAIKDASFRLAKMNALDKGKTFWLDEESMRTLHESIESKNFNEIRNYFVSFMSVYALSENYKKRKSGTN